MNVFTINRWLVQPTQQTQVPKPAAGMAVAAPVAVSPNVVGGKKRPTEALLPTYGIGLAAKGYNGQPVRCPNNDCIKIYSAKNFKY